MRRREFITLLSGAAATWPLAARAQQPPDRMRRLGILMAVAESDADVRKGIVIFQQQLQDLGWRDGHNIRIDYRWGDADPERIQALAKELVDLQPDVLVGHSTPSAKGLLKQTRSIPIVFLTVTVIGARVGRKPCKSGWQHNWIFGVRVFTRYQMAGNAQIDIAYHSTGYCHFQP